MKVEALKRKSNWQGIQDEAKRKQAREIALELANRLRDPEHVKSVVHAPQNVTSIGKTHPWDDTTLSHGYPAMILLFSELDRLEPGQGWDLVAHQYILAIKLTIESRGVYNVSMFGGLTGTAFAVQVASYERSRYGRFLMQFDQFIAQQTHVMIESAHQESEVGSNPAYYDVIQGVSGIGRYLLAGHSTPVLREALDAVLNYLVELAQPIEVDGSKVPGWYVSNTNQFLEKDKRLFPKGNLNNGLAHGIPGPLALLALSLREGIEVPGQREAIRKMTDWIVRWTQEDVHGIFWPDRVTFEQEISNEPGEYAKREAWCYGTPGVARALYLAGQALGDAKVCELALRGYDTIFSRPEEQWDLYAPTFCHGTSGLLQMTLRMHEDVGNDRYTTELASLTDRLLLAYDPALPFGYQDLEPVIGGYRGLDKAGLLEGVVGICLTLLSVSSPIEPIWDQPFLIS